MDKMADAIRSSGDIRETLRRDFPQFADIEIPDRITNSVTLSTMHGCPPDEIERDRALHARRPRAAHHRQDEPDAAGQGTRCWISCTTASGFDGDRHPGLGVRARPCSTRKALELIRDLQAVAAERGLAFGVKLSNTLAMHNHKTRMPGDEMYMSGRALYPVTMNLFAKLAARVRRRPARAPYSAGADALNIATILKCGAAAGHGLLGPAQARRLCPLRPVAEKPRRGNEERGREQPCGVRSDQAVERSGSRGGVAGRYIATRRKPSRTACPRSRMTSSCSTASRRRASRSARFARTCPSTTGG